MQNLRETPRLPGKSLNQLILYLLLLSALVSLVRCRPGGESEGQAQSFGKLDLETTPVFGLALSPDDRYVAVLTWKNYANSLRDQGITSIQIRIVKIEDGSIVRTVKLPDKPGQQVTDEVSFYWQDPAIVHIYFPDAHYVVDSESGSYSFEDSTGFVLPSVPLTSEECSWSPHELYCASVDDGTLRIQEAKGYIVWQQDLCDRSYPVCDAYPLIWTSDDKLVFASEDSMWIWSR
jgi:hypothetical protein